MTTTELTHPASEVPGELWDGAPVRATWASRDPWDEWCEDTEDGTWHDGGVAVSPQSGPEWLAVDGATVLLRLDDPLGLGLAGLAARVAERCRWSDLMGDACDLPSLLSRLRLRSWTPTCGNWPRRQVVCWAASYLALTDRLCALVGLELAEGEVVRWERSETLDPEDPIAWELVTTSASWEAPMDACATHHHIPALRAAVAAMEDNR